MRNRAKSGDIFSEKELLFNIHHAVVEAFDDNDYHFLEGLSRLNGENTSIYSLNLGN